MNNHAAFSLSPTAVISALLFATAVLCSLFFNNLDPTFLGLAGLFFLGLLAVVALRGPWPAWQRAFLPAALLMAFWLWTLVSGLMGAVEYVSFNQVFTFSTLPFIAWAVILLGRKYRFPELAAILLALIVVGLAVYACIQFFWLEVRPTATFINRNNFAAFQIPVVLLAITGLLNNKLSYASRGLCALVMILLSFMVGLIGSRGALLALTLGSVMTLGATLYLGFPRRVVGTTAALILASVMAANLAGGGSLGQKVLSTSDPIAAGKDRFAIWEGSLNLAAEAPWYGFGPGTFFLTYPRFRLDSDKSAAFYVHNDYLQLWIEAGWPAVILLLLAVLTAFYQACVMLVDRQRKNIERALAFALISGAAAVMGHSLLTFNLYLLPILMELGLLFGFLALLISGKSRQANAPEIHGIRIPLLARVILVLIMIPPGLELGRIIMATHHFDTGIAKLRQGESIEAIAQLRKATDWWPGADLYHYTLAWQTFQQATESFGEPRRQLLDESMAHLDKAQSLNPYRPQPHIIRALIFRQFSEMAQQEAVSDSQESALAAAEKELRTAMAKDPFYLQARFRLARLLLEQNQIEEGLGILEAGLGKSYSPDNLSMNYYRLTAEIRRITGDTEGYHELMEKVDTVNRQMENRHQKKDELSRRIQGLF